MNETALFALSIGLSAASMIGTLALFIVGLMISRQVADVKTYVHENFVHKTEFYRVAGIVTMPKG